MSSVSKIDRSVIHGLAGRYESSIGGTRKSTGPTKEGKERPLQTYQITRGRSGANISSCQMRFQRLAIVRSQGETPSKMLEAADFAGHSRASSGEPGCESVGSFCGIGRVPQVFSVGPSSFRVFREALTQTQRFRSVAGASCIGQLGTTAM